MDVPTNLEAQRRIAFFTNSLFMDMPRAPRVRNMLSFRYVLWLSLFLNRIYAPLKDTMCYQYSPI